MARDILMAARSDPHFFFARHTVPYVPEPSRSSKSYSRTTSDCWNEDMLGPHETQCSTSGQGMGFFRGMAGSGTLLKHLARLVGGLARPWTIVSNWCQTEPPATCLKLPRALALLLLPSRPDTQSACMQEFEDSFCTDVSFKEDLAREPDQLDEKHFFTQLY